MSERRQAGMLEASVRLGRVAGIPIGLHYSWFVIATLIALSLASYFMVSQPGWHAGLAWGVAIVTAVLFFATLLLHELSHAVVASARGIPVRSITLFALGGVAQMEKDASSAKSEFLIAIVGPITSFLIGFGCLALAYPLGWNPDPEAARTGVLGSVLGWLGSINIVLALFNLLPGYPLDGGRVLRAVLWWHWGDAGRATRGAARTGQVVAGLFIAVGLLQVFLGFGIGGLWLAFIGWFLLSAAQASYAQVAITDTLRGVRVADIMLRECATIDPHTSVQALVDDVLLRSGHRCVMVASNGHVVGLITPRDVRDLDRGRWAEAPVTEVMRPIDRVQSVTPETPAVEALERMAREDLNQLPVLRHGRLEGLVSRGQILRLVQARLELERG
jgi:Zn-dependent protease/predicted transcriptional regulator